MKNLFYRIKEWFVEEGVYWIIVILGLFLLEGIIEGIGELFKNEKTFPWMIGLTLLIILVYKVISSNNKKRKK